MTAREKLNAASVNGSLIVAAIAGCIAESWTVFLLVAGILLMLAVHCGDIRTSPRRRR